MARRLPQKRQGHWGKWGDGGGGGGGKGKDCPWFLKSPATPFVQTAGFMTEFGAYADGYGDDLADARRLLGLADDKLQSWQYWMVGCTCLWDAYCTFLGGLCPPPPPPLW